MDIKEKLTQIYTYLSGMDVRGKNNVLILAQTFVDLEQVINYLGTQNEDSSTVVIEEPIKESKSKKTKS